MFGDRLGEPDVTADNAVISDLGLAAEYGGSGVDGDVVAEGWMPLFVGVLSAYT